MQKAHILIKHCFYNPIYIQVKHHHDLFISVLTVRLDVRKIKHDLNIGVSDTRIGIPREQISNTPHGLNNTPTKRTQIENKMYFNNLNFISSGFRIRSPW
ncbi:Protein of unknown function [Thermobacillus xylanilyticus]|uniref:Uncharacterized protein n=1 Tax=Thermobacillus xylanilyticus TaxID=76633 RepID=A0ABN7RZ87_THEXY|nr:Protein of unknown function [Thermobacillus xylanilyticus]